MQPRSVLTLAVLISLSLFPAVAAPDAFITAREYAKHSAALRGLSVAAAKAMPADQYGFRPHPESMDFGQLMSHIAITNYQFCAGLKDSVPPALPSPTDKDAVVKFLSDSFEYCSSVISNLTSAQLDAVHDSRTVVFPAAKSSSPCTSMSRIIAAKAKSTCATKASVPPPIASDSSRLEYRLTTRRPIPDFSRQPASPEMR
jgi:hypothetical protein